MKVCPICRDDLPDKSVLCRCGYDFNAEVIKGSFSIPKNKPWPELLKIKKRVFELYQSKNESYTLTDVANTILHESKATLSQDLKLANSLEKYPELLNCKTKAEAQKQLKLIESNVPRLTTPDIFKKEFDLRDYLKEHWNELLLSNEWKLLGSEYDTNEIGRIDLFAKHLNEDKWLVIELKLSQASDQTIGQLLRYMGWVKEKIAKDKEVLGLIISNDIDLELYYALRLIKNVTIKLYKYENGIIQISDFDLSKFKEERVIKMVANLDLHEQEELLHKLKSKIPVSQ